MGEELRFINASSKRFAYVSPIPLTRHVHKIGLYASDFIWYRYYKTFSKHLNWEVVEEYKKGIIGDDVISMMLYMSLIGDNDFSQPNILQHLRNHKKLFYDCKIYTRLISSPKLIIDPIKIKGYKHVQKQFHLKSFHMMRWVEKWCKRQVLGSSVYLFEGPYYPKIKGFLISNGYEERDEHNFRKVEYPPRARFVYL